MGNKVTSEWKETLKLRNEELKDKNIEIFVDNVGEGYFNIVLMKDNGKTYIGSVVENDFEHELSDDINLAYRVAIEHYKEEQSAIYAVTLVSLSAEDEEENGFSNVKLCASLKKARVVLSAWKDEQVDELTRINEPWEVISNERDFFHITWNSGKHGIKIKIHTIDEVLK